mgnify:CR=1 FL=1
MRLYKHSHPELSIVVRAGRRLGNCYNEFSYRVTSLRRLSPKEILALRQAGFLGWGQQFTVTQLMPDGTSRHYPMIESDSSTKSKNVPSGYYEVQCSDVDEITNEIVKCPSINPYTEI